MNKQVITFSPDDPGDVLDAVAHLGDRGWVNVRPEVDDPPDPPSRGWFGSVFGSRGPVVPLATWHPGERSAGVQHDTGSRLARRVDVPAGWRVVQDHPRRGLVLRVPAGVVDADVLAWLVAVGTDLCPVPGSGRWIAEILTP